MNANANPAMQTVKARGRLLGKQLELKSLGQAKRVAVSCTGGAGRSSGLA